MKKECFIYAIRLENDIVSYWTDCSKAEKEMLKWSKKVEKQKIY